MLRDGIPIGRVFGISLRLHYTWFIIFVLVTWTLAVQYFPVEYPSWSPTTSILAGVITSLLFFGSVLAHELMHSVVAQKEGIPVRSITLFIFGGVSQMSEEPKRPQDEFRMAFAGPLTSLILGGIFLAIQFWPSDLPAFIHGISKWLGIINISLAGFNLIPGFPLDGGRVLRSLLWWRSGDLLKSTRIAANMGRGIGYLLIFGGIALGFITRDWFSGLWLVLIGWFLENAASGSYRQLALQNMLQGHTAKEAMTQDCPAVTPELNIERLLNEHILNSARRCFPVVQKDEVLGLVTLHNIKVVPRDQWSRKTVADVMTPYSKLKSVKPDDDLSNVLRILTEENINQVLVMKDSNMLGMIARDNLLSFINVRSELGM